ncbi:ATP-binding protein [Lusitaniella coriacea]|uniref:ATP-binding protein n=1 Tax=Lusitaniella coriacea TaxID=1983105 RepID=UPI003CE710B9
MKAPLPDNEAQRLAQLLNYNILDTATETAYDDLALLAAHICETPVSLVSLVDRDRQWFKAKVGTDVSETHRDVAFCSHAILQPQDVLVVSDARQDPRFADNPLVAGDPNIRFYAGAPLVTPQGHAIGTLCAIDYEPRTPSPKQIEALEALSRQVVAQLELRLNVQDLSQEVKERRRVETALLQSEMQLRNKTRQLERILRKLRQTQGQLIHAGKMSSLSQLVAGIAHEINNPLGFVASNLDCAQQYFEDLLSLIEGYRQTYPSPPPTLQEQIEDIDLDYLLEDCPKLFSSMKTGTQRIGDIVNSLRNFARLDEKEYKSVDLHVGLDNTLEFLQHRLQAQPHRPEIKVVKRYGQLPLVSCYAAQLNQVFQYLLLNAIEALDRANDPKMTKEETVVRFPQIRIVTELIDSDWVRITIGDNGFGMSEALQERIFEPFFTTKPVGQGMGLGLSTSYQIVTQKHQGELKCRSIPGRGTAFFVKIPICQKGVGLIAHPKL